jgi:hypothetical protein
MHSDSLCKENGPIGEYNGVEGTRAQTDYKPSLLFPLSEKAYRTKVLAKILSVCTHN